MLPPGGLMEIVFSFDTTGSMSSCLNEVRDHVQTMVQRLQADIPGIRIAIFAHGDYCDKSTYITKYIDFTTDVKALNDFVKTTGSTGGGDTDECYELVLRQVRDSLSWTPGSRRSLVLIGDAPPHEPDYPQNTLKINWRDEADLLGDMGVKIYATQCQSRTAAIPFYETIAMKTGGHYLQLQEFSNVFDFLMAVAYREHGGDLFQVYEKEVRSRCGEGINKDLNDLFDVLRDGGDDTATAVITTTPRKRKLSPSKSPATKKVKFDTKTKTTPIVKHTTITKISKRSKAIKKTKKIVKPRYPMLRREMVPESNFHLNDQRWSPWKLIVSNDAKLAKNGDWQKTGSHYMKNTIFETNAEKQSVYEFAVQTQPRKRRHVVFSKMAHSVSGKWERRLFGSKDIKNQVDKIADRGYSLFIRRLPFTSNIMKNRTIEALRKYDYSWKRIRNQRINHRRVEICSNVISDDSL